MSDQKKINEIYDKEYYDKYIGSKPYTKENYFPFFSNIANKIKQNLNPKTVFDAGCAKGFLVEALRDLGIEAYGKDISSYAISQTDAKIKKYVTVGSLTEPLTENYDLITCIEVLEHVSESDGKLIIENLCNHTNQIFFSSTPSDVTTESHENVQPLSYWIEKFSQHGFKPIPSYDLTYISPQAIFFKKIDKTDLAILQEFADTSFQLKQKILELEKISKERFDLIKNLENNDSDKNLQTQKSEIPIKEYAKKPQESEDTIKEYQEKYDYLERSINLIQDSFAYRFLSYARNELNSKFPVGSKKRKYLDKIIIKFLTKKQFFQTHSTSSELSLDLQYQLWLQNHTIDEKKIEYMKSEIKQMKYLPKISILVPVYNVEKQWLELAIASVKSQIYENWELCLIDDCSTEIQTKQVLKKYQNSDPRIKIKFLDENKGISGATNEALALATGDYIGLLDNDDELYPHALFEIANMLNHDQNADIIYSDEDKIDHAGRRIEPHFKPDWSPELLLSGNYITHFCVMKKELMTSVGGMRKGFEGSQDYDLFLRATDKKRIIYHIPKVLYGWRKIPGSAAASIDAKPYAYVAAVNALKDTLQRRNLNGTVTQIEGTLHYRIKYSVDSPLVSIIIPTCGTNLKKCIKSIESKTKYKNFEIILVDNNKQESKTDFLKSKHKVVKTNEDYNVSKIYNLGAKHASGNHLLFLDNYIEVINNDWLDALLEAIHPNEVGISSAMLLNKSEKNDTIQHAGIILGMDGAASYAFMNRPWNHPFYYNLHRNIRNCSAVTGACMLVKKQVFDEIGGWDETLSIDYSDVDFCLRSQEKGYRVVYTPYARLYHHKEITKLNSKDEINFLQRWKNKIRDNDPYYNQNLSHHHGGYNISPYSNLPTPMAYLMEIYLDSTDLQINFPEAKNGDFIRIINWVVKDGLKDIHKSLFTLFEEDFKEYQNLINEKKQFLYEK